MKLLRFGPQGQEKPGLLDAQGRIRDLSGVVADIDGSILSDEGLARLRAIDPESLPLAPEGVRYGPCVGKVGKFLCIGLNYVDHAEESGLAIPEEPVLFSKATSAIVGPNDTVLKPRGSTKLDWEVELGIVIGKHAAYVSEAEAESFIAGYCTINDVSERAFQIERGGTWDKGKGCDTFGPIGPWLVTRDEVPEPANLHMWLKVNGKTFQDGSTATMIFKPAFIVHYVSQFMSLQPGDVISTGTPAGVGLGQKPEPVYLNAGDVIELGIDGLGEQRQLVAQA
jgi:2-keto-4-pentenoate hydratase/2-oxohepta-3-ene-1,7-dioic acid hydratase in catechol pathway